jgi:hypothetical protein
MEYFIDEFDLMLFLNKVSAIQKVLKLRNTQRQIMIHMCIQDKEISKRNHSQQQILLQHISIRNYWHIDFH